MNIGTSQCCIKTATHGFNKNMCVFLVKYLNTYLQVMSHWPLSTDPLPPVLILKLHTHPSSPSFSPAVLCPPKHPSDSIIHLKAWTQKPPLTAAFATQVFTQDYLRQKSLVKLFSSTLFCCWFSPHHSSMHLGISPYFCIFSMVICVCVAHPKFPQTGRKLVQNLGENQEKSWMQALWVVFCSHHRNIMGITFGNTEPERLSRTDMAQGQQGHHTLLWSPWQRLLHTTTLTASGMGNEAVTDHTTCRPDNFAPNCTHIYRASYANSLSTEVPWN